MNILPRRKLVEKTLAKVRAKYNIHNRPFTEQDFYRICKGEKIYLLKGEPFKNLEIFKKYPKILGVCASSDGDNYIYLRCFFLKRFDLYTAMHELGHFFMGHCLDSAPQFRTLETRGKKFEPEADHFAELAIKEVR